jgi:preprotein translocase subunit SecG
VNEIDLEHGVGEIARLSAAAPPPAGSAAAPAPAERGRDRSTPHRRSVASAAARPLRALGLTLAIMLSAGVSGMLIGHSAQAVSGNRMAPWILGRASGVCSYLLLVALVLMGLLLSHPWRTRVRRPATASRIRMHIALSAFTLIFTVLHVVVLATDRYAGVGWAGAVLPMNASYRPVATTLGLIGLWAGLLAGITAALAGRLPLRLWWPIHKVAALSLVLIWLHGVLGGGDTQALLTLYLLSGGLVLIVAITRYAARTPADHVAEFEGGRRTEVRP